MSKIPDSWPPSPDEVGALTAPLFPLPDVWLFPRLLLPLQIFEPRYRQMIEDSMDGPGRIVMGTIVEGHEDEMLESPPVHAVAGIGEIVRHDRLPDGRFVIELLGLQRVTLREVESDRSYRRVAYEPLAEPFVDEQATEALRPALLEAMALGAEEPVEFPSEVPISVLADLLMMRMRLPHAELQALYALSDPVRRAEGALVAHAQRGSDSGPK